MKCAECGADLPADTGNGGPDGSPAVAPDATADVTLTGQGGTQLRIAGYGIAYRHSPAGVADGRWTLIDRDKVGWLRDGPRTARRPKWALEIVLTDGTVIAVMTAKSKEDSADPEVLETIKRAARAHGYLTALTGKPTPRMQEGPFAEAGLFPSPGAEPGLREWDGTGWSAMLHADPADGDLGGALATQWSGLSRQEQQQHWEDAVRRLTERKGALVTSRFYAVTLAAGFITTCAFTVALLTSLHPPAGTLASLCVSDVVLALCAAGCGMGARRARRSVKRHAGIAAAAQVAALRAGGHDVASAPETTWVLSRGQRRELRLDDHEITVREDGRTRFITWDSVHWFCDSSSGRGWALAIVLKDGKLVTPAATVRHRSRSGDAVAKVSQAARQHAIPAVLTGTPARPWMRPGPSVFARWVDKPGRYADPGGELGLREWTGTEWLPDLHVDPATSGTAGQAGPPVIVSPLPVDVQRGLWEEAASAVPSRGAVAGSAAAIGSMFAVTAGWLYWPSVAAIVNAHGPGLVVLGSAGIALLTSAGAWFVDLPRRNARAAGRLGRAARAALAASRASAEV
jgi:hypothetical protein